MSTYIMGPVAADTVTTTGNVTVGGALQVTGATTLDTTTTGNVTVGGALQVTGATTLDTTTTIEGLVGTPHAFGALGATYTTTSTTAVSTGFGLSLVSPGTALQWQVAAVVANATAGDGVALTLYRSTAGIPAAGSAPGASDVVVWAPGSLVSSAANQQQAVDGTGLDTGLTAGTTYDYYVAVASVTGGTAAVVGGSGNPTTLLVRAIA